MWLNEDSRHGCFQLTNLEQLCDAIVSILAEISEECFLHCVDFMAQKMKPVNGKRRSNTVLAMFN